MSDKEIERIKKLLDDHHQWPDLYMFKFVIPSDNQKLAQIEALFNAETAEIRHKPSSKGNYTAITIKEVMLSAQSVLDVYEKAREIEGLIAL
jgi:putative lipoic acid-binding regulatory protein